MGAGGGVLPLLCASSWDRSSLPCTEHSDNSLAFSSSSLLPPGRKLGLESPLHPWLHPASLGQLGGDGGQAVSLGIWADPPFSMETVIGGET